MKLNEIKQTKYGEFNSRAEMEDWLDGVVKGTYKILPNGEVNVDGSVVIPKGAKIIPVQFNEVTGSFDCSYTDITSLVGVPREVGGSFNCVSTKKITSLEGAPREVGGYFNCPHTQITSLEGAPRVVGGIFYCHQTLITSLKGIDKIIKECKKLFIPMGVNSNILGVMRIKNLEEITCTNVNVPNKLKKACDIINKHLETDRDILLAQRELIHAGLGQFARR